MSGGGQKYTQVTPVGAYLALLTGRDPCAVFARFDNHDTRFDLRDSINATWKGGALVSIANTGAPMPGERTFEVRVFGTDAMLFLELWQGTMRIHRARGAPRDYPRWPTTTSTRCTRRPRTVNVRGIPPYATLNSRAPFL